MLNSRDCMWAFLAAAAVACGWSGDHRPSEKSNYGDRVPRGVSACYSLVTLSQPQRSNERTTKELTTDRFTLRLDTARLSQASPAHMKRALLLDSASSEFPIQFWSSRSSSDSIRVTIGTGHTGYRLVFGQTSDSGRGYLFAFSESEKIASRQALSVTRLKCS
jgi:hypothetical protein